MTTRPLALVVALLMWPAMPATQQVFRTTADTVVLTVAVGSAAGLSRPLTAADFEVFDNGTRQIVEQAAVIDLPLDVTVLLPGDWWMSRKDGLELVSAELTKLSRAALTPADRLRVISSGPVDEIVPWRIGGVTVDAKPPVERPGADVSDALLLALSRPPVAGRRQVVVMFEDRAVDSGSAIGPERLPAAAARAETTLYIILGKPSWGPFRFNLHNLFTSRSGLAGGPPPLHALLQDAARATGGDAFLSAKTELDLAAAFRDMIRDFRSMYLLGFTPTDKRPGWHELRVRVKAPPNLTVRTRPGYFRK